MEGKISSSNEAKSAMVMASDSGSRLSQELHPMKNETLLALFFESCDLATLKSCRLVCRQWMNVSLSSWRRKAVLSLTNRKKMYAERTTLTLLELKKFVKGDTDDLALPQDLLKKPFQNYKFLEFCYGFWLNYQFFLRSFQEHIKFLEIPFNMKKTPCIALVNQILLELPNLQELRLKFVYSSKVSDYLGIHQIYPHINPSLPQHTSMKCLEVLGRGMELFKWREFLRIMPNLKKVKIGEMDSWSESISVLSSIMEAISSIRKDESKSLNLIELDIQPHLRDIPEKLMTSILDSRLPLKRLSIGLSQPQLIKPLLESHAKTLESFTVTILNTDFDDDDGGGGIHSPISIENLRELEIKCGLVRAFKIVASLVAPKLEKLILKDAPIDRWLKFKERDDWKTRKQDISILFREEESQSPPVIWSNLHTFECEQDWTNFPPEKIRIFAKAMPNLKHLSLPLTSESFREVCASWPKLWTLKTRWLDSVQTPTTEGFVRPKEEMQIGDEAITGIPSALGDDSDCGSSPCHPNLTDLKELTEFRMESSIFSSEAVLTDFSVVHGFLKLPRIHSLKVVFRMISSATSDSLKAHVPFCQITVSDNKEDSNRLFCW